MGGGNEIGLRSGEIHLGIDHVQDRPLPDLVPFLREPQIFLGGTDRAFGNLDGTPGDFQIELRLSNPEQHVATLNDEGELSVDVEIAPGRGYVVAEQHASIERPIGVISVDSQFSPIEKVNFTVENTRIGQRTDFDKLILDMRRDEAMLFDLARDPGESTNLAERRPGVVRELRALLDAQLREHEPERDRSLQIGDEAAQRLRALGYIE